FMDKTNQIVEDLVTPLFDANRRVETGVPAIYAPSYQGNHWEKRLELSQMKLKFETLRRDADVFLVHHVKHLWQRDAVAAFDPYQAKGNDQVFHALAQIRANHPNLKVRVLMCEYGPDVDASKKLAQELGVQDMIAWIPLSPRKEIMVAISYADAVIGEIERSWLTYGTVIEAMVLGKPVIHNRDDSFFAPRPLYPMYHAKKAEDIADAILRIVAKPDEAAEIGAVAKKWYDEETIAKLVKQILDLTPSNK
ncbi:glycosyltransferase, partial [Cognatishimia sp. D5M38]